MNPKPSTVIVIAVALLASAGCGVFAPASTPTAVPSNTPSPTVVPTDTPTPTPLPTATFTATPNATATQAVRATEQALKQSEQVKSDLEELEISLETGSLGFYQTLPQAIELTEYQQALYDPFAVDLSAADFVISTDATWDTSGLMTCGFFFRSDGNFAQGDEYIFEFLRLSGLPAWHIAYIQDGSFKNDPTGTKFSDALDLTNGATNNIVLVAEGEKFTLYINGLKQGSFYDYSKQRLEGKFAFTAWQESGQSTCKFENTAVWVYR